VDFRASGDRAQLLAAALRGLKLFSPAGYRGVRATRQTKRAAERVGLVQVPKRELVVREVARLDVPDVLGLGTQRALHGLELLRLAHGEHLAARENRIRNRVSKTRRAGNCEPSAVSHAVLFRKPQTHFSVWPVAIAVVRDDRVRIATRALESQDVPQPASRITKGFAGFCGSFEQQQTQCLSSTLARAPSRCPSTWVRTRP
jgi:hypothetical protein